MAANCGGVLSLDDLITAKKHQVFEAEVITGLAGGVVGGANIDYATNPNTGQVQKTLPAILRDLGFRPASFDFTTGGTLGVNERDLVVFDPVSLTWYAYEGTLPVVIPPGFNPVGAADWRPVTDPALRNDLANTSNLALGDALVGVKQPLAGATARTQHDKNADFISVKDFGAKGDGVTNDAPAFQAAIDAVNASGGGAIYIPATASGYKINSTLLLKQNVNLFGDGVASFLKAGQSMPNGLIQIVTSSTTGVAGRFVRDIKLVCDFLCNGVTTDNAATDTVAKFAYGFDFSGVHIVTADTGFKFQGLWHSEIRNCTTEACRVGLHLWGQNVLVHISGSKFRRDALAPANTFGIIIQPRTYAWNPTPVRSESIEIDGAVMSIGQEYGIYVYDCLDLQMSNLVLDYMRKFGVVIANVNGGLNIRDSWIAADAATTEFFAGIELQATSVQEHKLISGVNFVCANQNPANNNAGINSSLSSVGDFSVRSCTFTGGRDGVALRNNISGVSISDCVFNSRLLLDACANVLVSGCSLTQLVESNKPASTSNRYLANTGSVSTNGIVRVNIPANATSGTATIPNLVSGGLYTVQIKHSDSADKNDTVSINSLTGVITVTRPVAVAFAIPTVVEYTLL